MSTDGRDDWSNILESTYTVVVNTDGAFDRTLAATLGIKGLYEVIAYHLSNISIIIVFIWLILII